jgi:hypothetical protein
MGQSVLDARVRIEQKGSSDLSVGEAGLADGVLIKE